MSRYVIVNSKKKPPAIELDNALFYQTDHAGHALEIIDDICHKDPCAEIHLYGGDGSVFEAVNAVMKSGCSQNVTIQIHPFGTGNDFVRNFSENEYGKAKDIDLIRFGDNYAANEINVGFDCDVVFLTQKVKKFPLFRGGAAYMISALLTLFKKMGKEFDLTYTDEDGNIGTVKKKLLLCLIANGGFYGGGFNCAPTASLDDGLLELLCVDKISRFKFLTFFMGYRKGKHFNADGTICKKYASFVLHKRVKKVSLQNVGNVCADGETFSFDSIDISVERCAIKVAVNKKTK